MQIKNRSGELIMSVKKTKYGIYNLSEANLSEANLSEANLTRANLSGANLSGADLSGADLSGSNLTRANLTRANLSGANLTMANLTGANLSEANLTRANLTRANLTYANLSEADLTRADLTRAVNMMKVMGVITGNYYYKRFCDGLKNNNYQFYVGINKLIDGEVFASDERVLCSYPGFHFASKSWCAANYPDRPYEALIRIPKNAQINEPWATDGKASADMIEIIQIWDTKTGKDVTDQFSRPGAYPGEGKEDGK